MDIFGLKPWVNPFGKTSIFRLFELLFFLAQKGGFLYQNIVKDIFLAYIVLKKKGAKMVIFGPKPWVNPVEKNVHFSTFETSFFIAQKGVFSFQNIVRDLFLCYIAERKKKEKWPFLVQKHGLTPLEKCQFFHFMNLFFIAQKGVFSFQNIVKDIFLPFIA